jgi:hypothetical protein
MDRTLTLPKRAGLRKPPLMGIRSNYVQAQRLRGIQLNSSESYPGK